MMQTYRTLQPTQRVSPYYHNTGMPGCPDPRSGQSVTAWVRAFCCNSVYLLRFRSMKVPISVRTSYSKANLRCLVDSSATDNFIHPRFVQRMKLGTRELPTPKKLYNIDNTTNKVGNVTHYVNLLIKTAGKKKEMWFLVSDVGREDAILGYPWLATFEPNFSWRHRTIDT